ncbi:MAG TPA: hypothetical protein DEO59_07535 [Balneola sp.]|nr:hypothetical protein [Balneola sp.]
MRKISRIDGMYTSATSITANTTVASESSAIYVGVAGNYEFYVNDAWVHFKAVPAGTVLRIRATGARDQSDGSAPDAGDIVFLA